ncbi:MAG: biotin--[acetyl-CoA-carboxylase] ligase [Chlorobi bacterium]|nr:biotin--[acetyl-CoA-carboxylase] ligase [Chlorobiota bacterium]
MNALTSGILSRLHASRGYLSGEDLCREFGISRSAVWKHIGQLRDAGCRIAAVTGSGYRLEALSGTPAAAEVSLFLETRRAGRELHYHKQTQSTNLLAKKLAVERAPEGAVVVADTQSAGRGRLGRTWVSPPGSNLYFSLILRPRIAVSRIPQIPLLAAAAICRAIHDACPDVNTGIKWPNDILAGDRKLCGVLCEMQSDTDTAHFVIAGIGINVNQDSFPTELRDKASSLLLETGSPVCRPELLAGVLNRFEELYLQWLQEDDLGFVLSDIEKHSVLHGQQVVIDRFSHRQEGVVTGIAPGGELLLLTGEGKELTIASGEASLGKTFYH